MRVLVGALILSISSACRADEGCTLEVGHNLSVQHRFGGVEIQAVADSSMIVARRNGNMLAADLSSHTADLLNYNTLYRLSDGRGGSWSFRFAGAWFDGNQTGTTQLYSVQWASGRRPDAPGRYQLESLIGGHAVVGARTIATVGDSMIWLSKGQYLRCFLSQQLPGYEFVGNYTDSFGYQHDGHGGDDVRDVLRRIGTIPPADVYVLFVGANNIRFDPGWAADQIFRIADLLLKKRHGSRVLVSSVLPRGDGFEGFVARINPILRKKAALRRDGRIDLVDTELAFSDTRDPLSLLTKPDLVHPNVDGYKLIARLLASSVKQTVGPLADQSKAATKGAKTTAIR